MRSAHAGLHHGDSWGVSCLRGAVDLRDERVELFLGLVFHEAGTLAQLEAIRNSGRMGSRIVELKC